jgi:hypothetical protein
MRLAWTWLTHALKGHHRSHRNTAVLIPAEAHMTDEVWRLEECSKVSDSKSGTRVRIDGAE